VEQDTEEDVEMISEIGHELDMVIDYEPPIETSSPQASAATPIPPVD